MIRFILTVAALAGFAASAAAQPLPGRTAIATPVQPGAVELPVAAGTPQREVWFLDDGRKDVRNVSRPTLTPFLPVGGGNGTAVIVAPGGGFLGLAIEHEGWDVARWLANHGVAAFVLKYRVLPTPPDQAEFADQLAAAIAGKPVGIKPPDATPPEALADGLAALRYVRAHAADYGVDPARLGFMGFSAGGFLTRSVIEQGGSDAPAFAAPIYPSMAAMKVPANAPPLFIAVAADDFLLMREQGMPLVDSYRAAKRPFELHVFGSGGHGFGLGAPGTPPAGWPELFLRWLDSIGMMKPVR